MHDLEYFDSPTYQYVQQLVGAINENNIQLFATLLVGVGGIDPLPLNRRDIEIILEAIGENVEFFITLYTSLSNRESEILCEIIIEKNDLEKMRILLNVENIQLTHRFADRMIVKAAILNNVEMLHEMLGTDVTVTDPRFDVSIKNGYLPLARAIEHNSNDAAKYLINRYGTDLRLYRGGGEDIFNAIISSNNVEMFRFLLNKPVVDPSRKGNKIVESLINYSWLVLPENMKLFISLLTDNEAGKDTGDEEKKDGDEEKKDGDHKRSRFRLTSRQIENFLDYIDKSSGKMVADKKSQHNSEHNLNILKKFLTQYKLEIDDSQKKLKISDPAVYDIIASFLGGTKSNALRQPIKCKNCSKKCDKSFACGTCGRAVYCSNDCRGKDKSSHTNKGDIKFSECDRFYFERRKYELRPRFVAFYPRYKITVEIKREKYELGTGDGKTKDYLNETVGEVLSFLHSKVEGVSGRVVDKKTRKEIPLNTRISKDMNMIIL